MLFRDIPGLSDIKQTLIGAIRQGQVAHAQLFFGNEGGGNLAMALAYATFLNCEDKQPDDACGRCYACSKLNKLIHPDFHQIFPVATTKKVTANPLSENFLPDWRNFLKESPYYCLSDWLGFIGTENKQANISAEESRQVIGKLSLKAFEAEYKVLMLWLPEMMHVSAANALLKILEEPPPKTVFLLVSHQPDKVLTTIRSRTQLVQIRAFTDAEIAEVLTAQHRVEARRAAQIAQLSDGNLNRALRLTADAREDHHELFRHWMNLCAMRKYAELIEWTEKFSKLSRDAQKNLMQYGMGMVREALVWSQQERGLVRLEGEELAFVERFSKIMSLEKAEWLYEQFNEACFHLERNGSPKIVFLDTSLTVAAGIRS